MTKLIPKHAREASRGFLEFALLLTVAKGKVPAVYFDRQLNVGDALTPYLIEKLTGKVAYRVRSNTVDHLLGVGSIMHLAKRRSLVWGSGIIDPEWLPGRDVLESARFFAVRGRLTLELLAANGADVATVALGDPALVMPQLYCPKRRSTKYRIGLVPHYADREAPMVRYMASQSGVRLIDVRQQPEPFIDAICECETVVSSSLHGLILSDGYCIPNLWVRFSDGLIGGEFKFHDYYSTTEAPGTRIVPIMDREAADGCMAELLAQGRVTKYLGDPARLVAAFPFSEFGC
ncbi:MAG: polysaccharide pyruvyl transferase family protein [Halomonas sp.]|jgi:pyruvyltransferase|uniref:Polysaccharide pyruvyl transferase family protein n=1 Tax=Billgrantia tianxiuensis TaxID=2497861 RepID=A0A6I6ST93_9GAMM|nr:MULTISPECIES: polysaccharide pyruvyl transferase family protein [Halomonas]MCE8031830.1 polysaccharide pyruvyl transferase family protein [Halomonas sp. MCCC 1A11057]MDX5434500.1 polysaccharide pyruvyl transferase family protein [Halomonas sp.]QHC50073.1 polysaccharide pyruvyl transferase family protein [Halomonas tianxiuensis]